MSNGEQRRQSNTTPQKAPPAPRPCPLLVAAATVAAALLVTWCGPDPGPVLSP